MSDVYARQRASAQRLIGKFGQDMVLTLKAAGSGYDASTSTVVSGAPTVVTVRGVAFDCTEREIDGTTILQGDKNVTLPAVAGLPTPNVGDSIAIQGVAFRIEFSSPLSPSGAPILHQLRVRA